MEYVGHVSASTNTILCCQCGTSITPNLTNMCVGCLRTEVDITEGIPKQAVLYFCKKCERYLQPPSMWISAQLESRELLAVCLKKLKGINKVQLIDAGFVWTEPHSQRIKVKLTIQKEVMNSAVLQQVFIVEFTVTNHMCDDCHRVEAKDYWKAVVQIRQKTSHKKTFFYLEQLILKHKAHLNTVNIKPVHEGIDFYYSQPQDARKLVDFLTAAVPCRYQTAKELVSHDPHNNTYNYKNTFSVEIVPICKDNVVCMPKKLAQSLGNINPICVCYQVTQAVRLIDPNTLQIAEVSGTTFWRYPFLSLCEPKQLIEYMVMQIEIISEKDRPHRIPVSNKHVLADVWVSRMSDLGVNELQFFTRTHLGHLLNVGDSVLGFDFVNANLNNWEMDVIKSDKVPDVILVKKIFDRQNRIRKRKWRLRHLQDNAALETESDTRDYHDFLEDLEEDPAYRQNVNVYKDHQKIQVEADDTTDDESAPQISLQEMLDDLHIGGDATGGEGAPMTD
ncbi:60S ribosomal export protein NMD3-like [Gigantopelta aegis]|uniref:60S ribosomal export protein NMD3-like n=1 Tax=Gigantopelta aegis TaxID=1735272 RepID=UPI001B889813|nr:60S ribosomal export protein NMD3-like [Gigantopelta aegis]